MAHGTRGRLRIGSPGFGRITSKLLMALLAVVPFVAVAAATSPAQATLSDFTWTGATPSGATAANWSNTSNWSGGVVPAGTVGTLTFPGLSSNANCPVPPGTPTDTCYISNNDLFGLTANQLDFTPSPDTYNLTGNPFSLVGNGASPNLGISVAGGAGASLQMAPMLTASQTWTVGDTTTPNAFLSVPGISSGATPAPTLGISLTNQGSFDFSGSSDIGAISVSGASTSDTGTSASSNGLFSLAGSSALNTASTSPLPTTTVSNVIVEGPTYGTTTAATGPLSITGGALELGPFPGSSATAAPGISVTGNFSVDSKSVTMFSASGTGSAPNADYPQLAVTGTATLAGTLGVNFVGTTCPTTGTVYNLITASSISGTFSNAADGAVLVLPSGYGSECTATNSLYATIHYTGTAVTATISVDPPAVPTTEAATSVTQSSATLNGQVLYGQSGDTYYFEYGPTNAYGSVTPTQSLYSNGSSATTSVSFPLNGLSASTPYDYQLVLVNASSGSTTGGNVTFTTPAPTAPTATDTGGIAVPGGLATFTGTLNPNGAATSYDFVYGTSPTSMGSKTGTQNLGATAGNTVVSAQVTGLAAGSTYYFELQSNNSKGNTNASTPGSVVGMGPGSLGWTPQTPPPGVSFVSGIDCTSASNCTAVGLESGVFHALATTNSGTSWTDEGALPTSSVNGTPQFACTTSGCVDASGKSVWTSTDMGANWTQDAAAVTFADSSAISYLDCFGSSDCIILSSGGDIATSTDSGSTWTIGSALGGYSGNISNPNGVSCSSTSLCWVWGTAASTQTPNLEISTDFGASWTNYPFTVPTGNTSTYIDSAYCFSATSCVVSSVDASTGSTAVSFDASLSPTSTWSAATLNDGISNLTFGLGSITCPSATTTCFGWAGFFAATSAPDAFVVESTDAGQTWSTSAAFPGSMFAELPGARVACADATHCWAVGSNSSGGVILASTGVSQTALTSTVNPTTVGQSTTLTATVTGSGATPGGSVTFYNGSAVLCSNVALASGVASCITSFTSAGSDTLTAVYGGDANYGTSTSNTVSQVVNPGASTTSLTSSVNPTTVGQSTTLTATVTGAGGTPGGSVTFYNGATSLCSSVVLASGTASCITSFTSAGSDTLTASYGGDSNYGTSTSNAVSQRVNLVGESIADLSATPSTVSVGQQVTYSVTLAPVPNGGTVSFADGGTAIASCGAVPVNTATGVASCALSYASTLGSPHVITAAYSGDSSYGSATSGSVSVTVTTSTTVASSSTESGSDPAPSTTGISATSSGSGTVTVTNDGSTDPVGATTFNSAGAFVDVNVASGSSINSVTVDDCSLNGGNQLMWWNGSSWLAVSPQSYDSTTKCVSATLTSTTSPTIAQLTGTVFASAMVTPTSGYWLAGSDGGIFSFGNAAFYGSMGNVTLTKPVVGVAATGDGKGYWEVASDGGIFTFGDATFYGSMGSITLNKPVVGMAVTADGKGYWEVASDGGVFSFGDAVFYGSMGNKTLNQPIVGMAATPDGKGYWLVAADGGVFSFGDATFYGSMGNVTLTKPVVGIASSHDGKGYWLVASDGGIFSFGDAGFYGSMGSITLNKPVVGMAATADGMGYWLVGSDGGIFSFGDAKYQGSVPGLGISINNVKGIAAM